MNVISNHFDLVHFTECEFEKPVIFGGKIMIPTHNIGLLPSHPLNQSSEVIFLQSCCLIFEGVKKSVRNLTGYVEETPGSNKFIPCEEMQRTIIDDRFTQGKAVSLYELEGVFKNPLEWVDWEIESASFYLLD